ncbi:Chitin synthase, class 7 [Puccinia graminis f. sp. tritici]|uniref:Chitin synthase export chaperone n=1 Tax=Puccinia graminis f. sp. tritici TaxID=56615 RepID=A0A5B0Q3L9_PUCGR|nr:Chitin synthase, class 7 [Puccinia graminis f. sp. tritici]KAA1124683.1 Chitin synthase, class 7 [Puccinia graminis f. sp. tritici]
MGFSFGDFDSICSLAALIICPLMGTSSSNGNGGGGGSRMGIQPNCYARNVELNGTILFQPAVLFIHIIALIMILLMILHIKSKYTAVGRKEIVHFFYFYAVVTLSSFFLDSGIIPSSSKVYPYFAAFETGMLSATFWCLLVNGFVGFQFAEDGTPLSLWSLRGSCLAVFSLTFFIAIATFNSLASFTPSQPTALWIIMYIFNGACVAIYVILQLLLVVRTLDDRWPIGDILFGLGFFVVGLVLIYGFSLTICSAITHYVDGLFFSQLCFLLSVMMVYKYWDSITKEDLEFSVGSKQAVWEISSKEALLSGMGSHSQTGGAREGREGGGLGGGQGTPEEADYYQHNGSSAQMSPTHSQSIVHPNHPAFHGGYPPHNNGPTKFSGY